MGRKSPARLAADAVLADGEWHDREAVITQAALAVPAARAIQARRKSRDDQARRIGYTNHCTLTLDEEARIGSRIVARNALGIAVVVGAYERDGDLIRLRPKQ